MNNPKLLHFLRSNTFALSLAIGSILAQSFHSFVAFYNMSSLKGTAWGIVQAVIFAIIVDGAILFYTVRGKKDVVMFASVFLVIINGYYYFNHLGASWELLFAGFLSLLLPVTQYFYSEELVPAVSEVEYENDTEIMLAKLLEDEKIKCHDLQLRIRDLDDVIKSGKAENKRFLDLIYEAEKKNKELSEGYYTVVAQRDAALNKNSELSEALGRRVSEIVELKKDAGAESTIQEEVAKLSEEISDKSLLNVLPNSGYNPTRSDGPVK